MTIKVTKKLSKAVLAFAKKQWANADVEIYGKAQDWNPIRYAITAYADKEILASLDMKIKVGVAEIETLIVADDERGHGIGAQLFAKAEMLAKKHNAHKLFLSTGKGWMAEAFYKKQGMIMTGTLENHFDHHDFVQYSKFI
jgi:N-acetylglutamate synthase-like GNAT family acetyltransferase